jgi:MoaA/NifB/PqqE/SkfB family radical SAM enzyme
MKHVQISITTHCDRKCDYCPMKDWWDFCPPMDITALCHWLTRYWEPDWVVEVTGGEPSSHKDFQLLRNYLTYKGVRTIIRTNNPTLVKQPNETILCALHGRKLPKSNEYLRLGFFKCEDHEVAERFNGVWPKWADDLSDKVAAPCGGIEGVFIATEGQIRDCAASGKDNGNIANMDPPKWFRGCQSCAGNNMCSSLYSAVPAT